MYRVELSPRAKKQFKSIKKKESKTVAGSIVEELKMDPFIGKPLRWDLAGYMSYRVGNFRIVYKVNKKDRLVSVIKIGPRSRVYN